MATGVLQMCLVRPESSQEGQPIEQRHPQVENDGVWPAFPSLPEAGLRADRRPDPIPFETQHPREGLRHRLVVVHDENRGRGLSG